MSAAIKRLLLPRFRSPERQRSRYRSATHGADSADRLAGRLELLLPVALAIHGVIVLVANGSAGWEWLVLELVAATGAASLLFSKNLSRRSRRTLAIRLRAIMVSVAALGLIAGTGGPASAFAVWLYVIVAVYPLLLRKRWSLVLVGLISVSSVTLGVINPGALSIVEVSSQGALLLFLGVLTHNLGVRLHSYDYVRRLANVDELTRVYNRRHFFERAYAEYQRCRRTRISLTAVMFDLNEFKRINDTFGHALGDECLRRFARHLTGEARKGDTVARLGGDEFVVLMPDTGVRGAAELIGRLRKRLSDDTITAPGTSFKLDTSAGVSTLTDSTTSLEDLLERADRDLYRAKERNARRSVRDRRRHLRVA